MGDPTATGDNVEQQTVEELIVLGNTLRIERDRLRAAILDIDAHATPMGSTDDGIVSGGYIISVGSLHRALGVVGHSAKKVEHAVWLEMAHPDCEACTTFKDIAMKAPGGPPMDDRERCPATKAWVNGNPHSCTKPLGHHGVHLCNCDEDWLNADDWTPCPSEALSVLGMVNGQAMVRCGLQIDHQGPHRFAMEWEGGIDIDRRRISNGGSFTIVEQAAEHAANGRTGDSDG